MLSAGEALSSFQLMQRGLPQGVGVNGEAGSSCVTQVGHGKPSMVSGFGKNMLLKDSLDLILPDDWTYEFDKKAKDMMSMQVSWHGGIKWTDVIENIGKKNYVRFVINWPHKHLYVMSLKDGYKKSSSKLTDGRSYWKLEPGAFKPQLQQWAQKSSYKLIWRSDYDYMIEGDVTIEGSFIDAVSQVLNNLYENGINIYADIYRGNKVLYIKGQK